MSGTAPYLIGMSTLGALFLAANMNLSDISFANMLKEKVDADHMFCESDPQLGPVVRDAENNEVVYALNSDSRKHTRIADGYDMDVADDNNSCGVTLLHGGGRIFEMKS